MFLLAHMTSQNAPGYIFADYYIWTVTAGLKLGGVTTDLYIQNTSKS